MDAALVATPDGNERLFLLMLGCGFDAEVVGRLHAYRTGPISRWSYARPILESMRAYKYPKLSVTCYDAAGQALAEPQDARWAFVFNFPFYALGLEICNDADPRDGTLDVITFPGRTVWQGLFHLVAVLLGRHRRQRGVEVLRAARLRIAAEHPVPIQLDGDPAGHLPVDVRVLPNHWTAVIPEHRHAGGTGSEISGAAFGTKMARVNEGAER
jgi:diacylglycerol kinase family enzyme